MSGQPLTQKERILARLRQGPATNRDLNEIAFRYGARIHELHAEGHVIRWKPVKGKPGLNRYELVTA